MLLPHVYVLLFLHFSPGAKRATKASAVTNFCRKPTQSCQTQVCQFIIIIWMSLLNAGVNLCREIWSLCSLSRFITHFRSILCARVAEASCIALCFLGKRWIYKEWITLCYSISFWRLKFQERMNILLLFSLNKALLTVINKMAAVMACGI